MHIQLAERLNLVRMQLATNSRATILPMNDQQVCGTNETIITSSPILTMVEAGPVLLQNESKAASPKAKYHKPTGDDIRNIPLMIKLYDEGRLNDYYTRKVSRWLRFNDRNKIIETDNRPLFTKNEKNWVAGLDKAAETFKSCIRFSSISLSLLGWLQRQSEFYKQGKLNEWQQQKLAALLQLTPASQPVNETTQALWDANFEALIDYKRQNDGRLPNMECAQPAHRQLAAWHQLLIFQKKQGLLPPGWDIRMSEMQSPFNTNPAYALSSDKPTRWERLFHEMKQHIEQYGSVPNKTNWGKYLRYLEFAKMYPSTTPEQQALFNSLGFKPVRKKIEWSQRYDQLTTYMQANGHVPGSDCADSDLYEWLKEQISQNSGKKLSADRHNRLREAGIVFPLRVVRLPKRPQITIGEFKKMQQELWNSRYQALIAFRQQHPDRWPKMNKEEIKLKKWCLAQKQAKDGRKDYKLPQDRIDKLNAIGFPWQNRG